MLKKILYVEDEPDVQTIVKLSLENIGGYELRVCGSGKQALEEVNNFVPDLFLLDVMMPDMDGPATLEKLHSIPELEKIPAIFITAKAQVHEIAEYNMPGVLGVVTKPFDPVKLPEEIEEIWEKNNARVES